MGSKTNQGIFVIDLITVVYEPELNLLKTQALSIQTRFKLEDLNKIYIVINDYTHVAEQIYKEWYGVFANKVEIVLDWPWTADDEAHKNCNLSHGWNKQQPLKLLAAAKSNAEWCMILDAKTWFVKNYNYNDFFTNNKARCQLLMTQDCFITGQKILEEYFQTSNTGKTISPAGVPALLKPNIVREIIKTIENREQENFLDYFIKNTTYYSSNGLIDAITEFVLYSVYILHKQFFSVYYTGEHGYKCNNIAVGEGKKFDQTMLRNKDINTATVSIHRRAYEELSDVQKQCWVEYLTSKGLTLF